MRMSRPMKLLLDENCHHKLVSILESDGHEVLHIKESALRGKSDEKIMGKANAEGWTIVTHDKDFAELVRLHTFACSVILIRPANQAFQLVKQRIDSLLSRRQFDLKRRALYELEYNKLNIYRM